MKKLLILPFVLGLMVSNPMDAQQIPLYSNYFFTPFIYNPSYSGKDGVTEASMMHRRQWSGIEGGPETSALTINGALNREKVGYSIYGFNDRTDIIQRTGVYGSYAYHIQLSRDNFLSFGLAAGYMNNSIDFDKIRVKDEYDALLYPNLRRGNFDLNFGFNLNINGFHFGAAVPQLLGAPIEYSDNYNGPVEYSLIRHFVFNAQYDWEIQGDNRVLSPMVMVRTAQNVPTQIDIGAIFNMKEYGYVGAMFRSDYAITANLGIHLTEQLTAGYAYDFSTNTYGTSFGTSHEFMLTYRFGSDSDDERIRREIRGLKEDMDELRENQEDNMREMFEEYQEEMSEQREEDLETEVRRIVEGMDLATAGDPRQQGGGNPRGGNPQQGGGDQRGGTDNPNTGSETSNPRGGGDVNTTPNRGGGVDYDAASARNVEPGSPGYYVTAGVFGSERNARRLMERLQGEGLDVNIFRDSGNSMYYVFLLKFENYNAADQARSSGMNGRYDGRLWVKIVE
ncbi:MAG: PorP/SprF family type IX secretion system membrane protein [Flavobacteriia bacterium]|nr:PorP/SprF family type IX secretion system membrane protein [Flavobacteriia bacterium]